MVFGAFLPTWMELLSLVRIASVRRFVGKASTGFSRQTRGWPMVTQAIRLDYRDPGVSHVADYGHAVGTARSADLAAGRLAAGELAGANSEDCDFYGRKCLLLGRVRRL